MQPKQPQPQVLYRKYENVLELCRSISNHFTYLLLQLHLVAVLRGVGLLSQVGEVVVAKVSVFYC